MNCNIKKKVKMKLIVFVLIIMTLINAFEIDYNNVNEILKKYYRNYPEINEVYYSIGPEYPILKINIPKKKIRIIEIEIN